jgi:hypothetical protein
MPDHGDVWSIAVQAAWNNAAMESFFCSPKIERTARKIQQPR